MVLALGVTFEFAPDSVIDGEDMVPYFMAFAGVAALLAYLLQFVFSMFRWVLAGYEEGARRQFLPFLLLLLAVAAVAIFAGMFRHESSPPYVASNGCWYTLRDRWTGDAKAVQIQCPVSAVQNADRESWRGRDRLLPVASDGG